MTKRDDFMPSFNKMRTAFRQPFSKGETAVYLEYLGNLPYISEVMSRASRGVLGLDPNYLPTVAQLIEAHDRYEKEVEEKVGNENDNKFGLPEGSFMSKREGHAKFAKIRKWLSEAPNGTNPFVYAHKKLE